MSKQRPHVIVVGGSFNPPHREHTRAIEFAAQVLRLKNRLVHSAHMAAAPDGWVRGKLNDDQRWIIDEAMRVRLCDAAASDCDVIAPQTLGRAFGSAQSMFKALVKAGLCPADALFVDVVGSDRAVDRHGRPKWERANRHDTLMLCIARAGAETDMVLRALGLTEQEIGEFAAKPRILSADGFLFVPPAAVVDAATISSGDLSSTKVRAAIERRAPRAELETMLLPSVLKLMSEHQLMGLSLAPTDEEEDDAARDDDSSASNNDDC